MFSKECTGRHGSTRETNPVLPAHFVFF
jgi:hypothetical protein